MDIITEGKKSNFLKLVYLKQFVIYKCNIQTLVFLVLSEPSSVQKTIFGTTCGLNTSVYNTASPKCS